MLEKEKQLKINRLAQEVCALSLSQQAPKGQFGITVHRWTDLSSIPVQRARLPHLPRVI